MKTIRPATVTIAMAAIFMGLIAAYTARRYFEPRPVKDDRVAVVVPGHNLPKYSRIRPSDLTTKLVPKEQAPSGAIQDAAEVTWRTAKDNLLANKPIFEQSLYGVGDTPTLADQLPPGFRAVTIAVERINALGGLLVPESYVDINMTFKSDHPDFAGVVTKTILEQVKVLATSEQRFRSEEQASEDFRSVTVAVTPDQANMLILAQRHGTLSVTLRAEQDTAARGQSDIVSVDQLTGIKPATPFTARVWRGSSVAEVSFQGNPQTEPQLGTATRPTYLPSIYRPAQLSSRQ